MRNSLRIFRLFSDVARGVKASHHARGEKASEFSHQPLMEGADVLDIVTWDERPQRTETTTVLCCTAGQSMECRLKWRSKIRGACKVLVTFGRGVLEYKRIDTVQ